MDVLAAARRARGLYLRQLVVAGARRLKALIVERFDKQGSAKERIARSR